MHRKKADSLESQIWTDSKMGLWAVNFMTLSALLAQMSSVGNFLQFEYFNKTYLTPAFKPDTLIFSSKSTDYSPTLTLGSVFSSRVILIGINRPLVSLIPLTAIPKLTYSGIAKAKSLPLCCMSRLSQTLPNGVWVYQSSKKSVQIKISSLLKCSQFYESTPTARQIWSYSQFFPQAQQPAMMTGCPQAIFSLIHCKYCLY